MKKLLFIFLMGCLSSFSQNQEKFQPHLERKNEIRLGIENRTTSIEYERQTSDHFSLGAVVRFGHNNEEPYYDDYHNEQFNITARGRYYIKDYITQSFLYIFFDDAFKIRYFIEGNLGYSSTERVITERVTDSNNNYVLQRGVKTTNGIITSIGFGAKLLLNKKISVDYSFGPGRSYIKNHEYYGYGRIGIGYRF